MRKYIIYYTFLTLLLVSLTTVAFSHSWFDNWCCGIEDCLPVPCEDIDISNKTYNNEEYSKVLPTQDNSCYACKPYGDPRCLYVKVTG